MAKDFHAGCWSLSNDLLHAETERELLDPVSDYHKAWMNLAATQSVTWIEDLTRWIDRKSAVTFKKAAEIAVKLNHELGTPPLLDGEMRFINAKPPTDASAAVERDAIQKRFNTEDIIIRKLTDAENQNPTIDDQTAIRCLAQFGDTLPDEVEKLYDLLRRAPILENETQVQNHATAFIAKKYEIASGYLRFTDPAEPSLFSRIKEWWHRLDQDRLSVDGGVL